MSHMTKVEIDATYSGSARVHAAMCELHGHDTGLSIPELSRSETGKIADKNN